MSVEERGERPIGGSTELVEELVTSMSDVDDDGSMLESSDRSVSADSILLERTN